MSAPTLETVEGTGRQYGYGVRLGSEYFRLATGPDRRVEFATAPLEAPRVNTSTSAEDVSTEFGSRFSLSDFSGGEGLTYANRPDTEGNRYYDSQNVDFDDDGNVKLLHAPEVSDALTTSNNRLAYDGTNLYATDGTNVRLTTNPESDTPTWVDDNPHDGEGASTVTGIASVGTTMFAAVSDGIHRKAFGGAWAHWTNEANIDNMWSIKGHLYVSVDNVLYSYNTPTATPSQTTVLTIAVGEVFHDMCDAGSHVLVTASDGYIYSLTDDGTTIALAGQTFLEGEEPWGIGAAWGVVVYGTRVETDTGGWTGRLYSSTITSDGVLANIDRRRVFVGGAVDRTPLDVSAVGDSMYVCVAESSTVSSLWRYDLSTGALHRSFRYDDAPVATDIEAIAGRLYWTVDTVGVMHESGDYASSGYVITPLADLFTAQQKTWTTIDTAYSDLTNAGDKVAVSYTTATDLDNSTQFTSLVEFRDGDTTSSAEMPGVKSRYLAIKVALTPTTDLTTTPLLRSVSARAYPTSDEVLVRFPVSVADQIERPGKRRTSIPGLADRTLVRLQVLEGAATTCELPQLEETLRGIVERVERSYSGLTDRGGQSTWAWVTFRGRRVGDDNTEGLILMGTYGNGLGLMATSPTMGDSQ